MNYNINNLFIKLKYARIDMWAHLSNSLIERKRSPFLVQFLPNLAETKLVLWVIFMELVIKILTIFGTEEIGSYTFDGIVNPKYRKSFKISFSHVTPLKYGALTVLDAFSHRVKKGQHFSLTAEAFI